MPRAVIHPAPHIAALECANSVMNKAYRTSASPNHHRKIDLYSDWLLSTACWIKETNPWRYPWHTMEHCPVDWQCTAIPALDKRQDPPTKPMVTTNVQAGQLLHHGQCNHDLTAVQPWNDQHQQYPITPPHTCTLQNLRPHQNHAMARNAMTKQHTTP